MDVTGERYGQPADWKDFPLRADLPPLPQQVADLPVAENGYPVPWFVEWINGKPEFRAMDPKKLIMALRDRRCWVCGRGMAPGPVAFVVGPMCTVNRISAEPPSHFECAVFSVKACPFLAKPHMKRRENDLPPDMKDAPGVPIKSNPGVMAVWLSQFYGAFRQDQGVLIDIKRPHEVHWFTEGRPATRDEVAAAFDRGVPALRKLADEDKDAAGAHAELDKLVAAAQQFWPAAAP